MCFEVGSFVRCVDNAGWENHLTNGRTYEVVSFYHSTMNRAVGSEKGVTIKTDRGVFATFYNFRFEQIASSEPEFNLSTATDQELADEYRRLRAEDESIATELIKRGYSCPIFKENTVVFMKTETIEL